MIKAVLLLITFIILSSAHSSEMVVFKCGDPDEPDFAIMQENVVNYTNDGMKIVDMPIVGEKEFSGSRRTLYYAEKKFIKSGLFESEAINYSFIYYDDEQYLKVGEILIASFNSKGNLIGAEIKRCVME